MKKYLPRAVPSVVASAWLIVAGCASSDRADTHPFFAKGIQEPDIPIPQSFQFDKNNPESFSFIPYSDRKGVGYFRSTEGIYYGNQMVGNLIPWYQEQMPVDGWTAKESRLEMGRNRLTFVKKDEVATVWIYRQFDSRFDQYLTFIKFKVGPIATEAQTPEELLGANPTPTLESILKAGEPPAPEKGKGESQTEPSGLDEGVIQKLPSGTEQEAVTRPAAMERTDGEDPVTEEPNKQVVKERPGKDNNEDSPSGDEVTPDDE